jgi:hypothetical protein
VLVEVSDMDVSVPLVSEPVVVVVDVSVPLVKLKVDVIDVLDSVIEVPLVDVRVDTEVADMDVPEAVV